jgi:hypothetical protein
MNVPGSIYHRYCARCRAALSYEFMMGLALRPVRLEGQAPDRRLTAAATLCQPCAEEIRKLIDKAIPFKVGQIPGE